MTRYFSIVAQGTGQIALSEPGELRVYVQNGLDQQNIDGLQDMLQLPISYDAGVVSVKVNKTADLSLVAQTFNNMAGVVGWQLIKPVSYTWLWILGGIAGLALLGRKQWLGNR